MSEGLLLVFLGMLSCDLISWLEAKRQTMTFDQRIKLSRPDSTNSTNSNGNNNSKRPSTRLGEVTDQLQKGPSVLLPSTRLVLLARLLLQPRYCHSEPSPPPL